jgi:hypothetical protein
MPNSRAPPLAGEEIADLRDDWTRNQDPPARQMQRGEQIDALAEASVVSDSGSHQRPRVAGDHRLAAEALSE